MDDVGTEFSTPSYIRALPLDRLKIDRAFISDLPNPDARPIVQTIIDLCSTLNLSVIAAGVETEVQLQTLKAMRCDVLQGCSVAPALFAPETLDLIAHQIQISEQRPHSAPRDG